MASFLELILLIQLPFAVHVSSQHLPGDKCHDAFGSEGICRPIYLCPPVFRISKGPHMLNRLCGIHWTGPLLCCPLPEKKTVTTTTISPARAPIVKPGERAMHWCKKYSAISPKVVGIIGGEVAKPEEFPHMAAIGYGGVEEEAWGCGGSLISKNFILTAAHCLERYPLGPARWVRLGTEELENSVRGQTHPVIRRIPHPEYNRSSKYNDVALLEIGPALESHPFSTVSKQVHPICLPSLKRPTRVKKAVATGWGQTELGGEPSPILLKVSLNIIKRSICNETFPLLIKPHGALERGVDSTMICAGRLCGGKDTCRGDSGGPLQVRIRHSGMYEILGITSFGNMCGCKNSPSVYTNVYEYVHWIENIVWP